MRWRWECFTILTQQQIGFLIGFHACFFDMLCCFVPFLVSWRSLVGQGMIPARKVVFRVEMHGIVKGRNMEFSFALVHRDLAF
jgi:hypothetical protein